MELVFTGRYTGGDGNEGIQVYRWANGTLEPVSRTDCISPSFLAYSQGCLYAACETDYDGYIAAYAVDKSSGELQLLNKIAAPCQGLCHIDVMPDGKTLCAAAYTSGHVITCSILPDGSLGQVTDAVQHEGHSVHPRQTTPHAHQALSFQERLIIVSDLGIDAVRLYSVAPDGRLSLETDITVPAGEGPRHALHHPSKPWLYVLTEIGNNILMYTQDGQEYRYTQTSAFVPENISADSAELQFSKDGRFIYASVRGYDRIIRFLIDEEDGTLSQPEAFEIPGEEPRMFSLSDDGEILFAALQKSGRVAVMRVDTKTGGLTDVQYGIDIPDVCFVQSFVL